MKDSHFKASHLAPRLRYDKVAWLRNFLSRVTVRCSSAQANESPRVSDLLQLGGLIMVRQFLQCLAVVAAIGLLFTTAENANAWHRSGGSHGSHGSFGGMFGGSHGGSFGGFFSRHHGSYGSHGSHGGYGSHGAHASACDCNNTEADNADHVDVDDGSDRKEAVKQDDTSPPADESK
jgi:hypothetical protein